MKSKVLSLTASLVMLVFISFLVLKFLPGSPLDQETTMPEMTRQYFSQKFGLNLTVPEQVFLFFKAMISADLGESLSHPGESVLSILSRVFKTTVWLNSVAIFLIFAFGIFLAVAPYFFSASIRNLFNSVNIFFISVPTLILAPLLLFLFTNYWQIFPIAFLDSPLHYVLPTISISLRPIGLLASSLSQSISEQFGQDYIRTARAKGVKYSRILLKHVLKNSMVSVLALAPQIIIGIISGSFIVEILFVIPGAGLTLFSALQERDYPLIVGLVFFIGLIFILLNFLMEFLLSKIDPRTVES